MLRRKPLNWYARDKSLTKGLRKFFAKRKSTENYRTFTTLRLGAKWANRLNPGDKIPVSISDDPGRPNIIGYAEIGEVRKTHLALLRDEDFKDNIGAKTFHQAVMDMQKAYGRPVSIHEVVTIIELVCPIEEHLLRN